MMEEDPKSRQRSNAHPANTVDETNPADDLHPATKKRKTEPAMSMHILTFPPPYRYSVNTSYESKINNIIVSEQPLLT